MTSEGESVNMRSSAAGDNPSGLSLWRNNRFLVFWSAYSLSLLGTHVSLIAIPLLAVLTMNASPIQVGTLTAMGYLPFLLIGLPAGVWVDRMPRMPILICADLGRACLLLIVPVAYFFGFLSLELLYPIVFFIGVLTVFGDIAHQALLPSLIDREQLVEGNTKLQMSHSIGQLGGPLIGGALVKLASAPVAIVVDAVSYLFSAALLFLIRGGDEAGTEPQSAPRSLSAEIREGLKYVLGHPLLRPLVMSMGIANLFGMVPTLLPLYAVRELGLSAFEFGTVLGLANVGALLGAISGRKLVHRWGLGRILACSSVVPGLSILLLPFASNANAVFVLGASLAVGGFGIALFNVNQVSLRQTVTPAKLQGRMNATVRFLVWGTIPVGAFVGGLLGETLGIRSTLFIAGLGSLCSVLPIVLSSLLAQRQVGSIQASSS